MLDNMVVPLSNGDVDVSLLKEAVELINGRFETEVIPNLIFVSLFSKFQDSVKLIFLYLILTYVVLSL